MPRIIWMASCPARSLSEGPSSRAIVVSFMSWVHQGQTDSGGWTPPECASVAVPGISRRASYRISGGRAQGSVWPLRVKHHTAVEPFSPLSPQEFQVPRASCPHHVGQQAHASPVAGGPPVVLRRPPLD